MYTQLKIMPLKHLQGQALRQGVGQEVHVGDGGVCAAPAAAGDLDRAHLHAGRQHCAPPACGHTQSLFAAPILIKMHLKPIQGSKALLYFGPSETSNDQQVPDP